MFNKIAEAINDKYYEVFDYDFKYNENETYDKETIDKIYQIADVIVDPSEDLFSDRKELDKYHDMVDNDIVNTVKSLAGEEHPAVEVAKYIKDNGY